MPSQSVMNIAGLKLYRVGECQIASEQDGELTTNCVTLDTTREAALTFWLLQRLQSNLTTLPKPYEAGDTARAIEHVLDSLSFLVDWPGPNA